MRDFGPMLSAERDFVAKIRRRQDEVDEHSALLGNGLDAPSEEIHILCVFH